MGLQKLRMLFRTNKKNREISDFLDIGFHGDKYLIAIIDLLVNTGTKRFIETGCNVGTTLAFFAKKYENISCLSCEPDNEAFVEAEKNINNFSNAKIFNELSQDFLARLNKDYQNWFSNKTLFWLDAHGYGFEWPLKQEINFFLTKFTDAIILIDDFKVPHLNVFGYDDYKKQICSYDFIKDSIPNVDFELYYPNYTQRTSKHHPLRGWGLFIKGNPDLIKTLNLDKRCINAKVL